MRFFDRDFPIDSLVSGVVGLAGISSLIFTASYLPQISGSPLAVQGSWPAQFTAQALTEYADVSFHMGEDCFPIPKAVPEIIEEYTRLVISPPEGWEPSEFSNRLALSGVEWFLSLAFYLDPSNPRVYQIYFDFLFEGFRHAHDAVALRGRVIEEEKRSERLEKAVRISKEALSAYKSTDPLQMVAASIASFNLFLVLSENASQQAKNKASEEALKKIDFFLNAAKKAQSDLVANNKWNKKPVSWRNFYDSQMMLAEQIRYILIKKRFSLSHK